MAKDSFSRKLGKGLAHVQSALDDLVDFGFKKMRQYSEKNDSKKSTVDTIPGRVKYLTKAVFGILGNMGEGFYDEYEDIKAFKARKKEKGKE